MNWQGKLTKLELINFVVECAAQYFEAAGFSGVGGPVELPPDLLELRDDDVVPTDGKLLFTFMGAEITACFSESQDAWDVAVS